MNTHAAIAEETSKTTIAVYVSFLVRILLAGAALPLAFAPYKIWSLAILSPAYLLWVWLNPKFNTHFIGAKYFNTEPKQAFLTGFIYALGMFGAGVSWVFVSIHEFGNTDAPIAVFLTAAMIFLLAILTGFQGYLLKRFFKGSNTSFCLLGFPCLWVLFEWFRSVYFTGFPWLFLGYTQLNTPLAGFAPIGSVYAVSLMVTVSSGAAILLLQRKFMSNNNTKTPKAQMLSIGLAFSILMGAWGGGELLRRHVWIETEAEDFTVSLVQGNISPVDKFAQTDPIQAARKTYVALSGNNWTNNLIIWPENAIAYPLPMVQPFIDELNNLAQANNTTLITGLQTILHNRDYYNSMIAVGMGSGIYHKRHLVPFGDYLPFEEFLRGLISFFDIPMSSFLAGPNDQSLLKAGALNVAPMICYEIAFPELMRETARHSNCIVTVSEDGWFGDSLGPHQHLEIARMRALETGRPLLRATTSGISAIIDGKGQLVAVSPQFQALVLNGTFKATKANTETPWMKLGLIPLFIILLLGFILPGRSGITKKLS